MGKLMNLKIITHVLRSSVQLVENGKDQGGSVLVGVLISMVFFMTVTVAVSEYSVNHFSSTKRTLAALDALAVAEAGADSFLYNINQVNTYTGTAETNLYTNDPVKGRGTYQSSVANGTVPNEKIVFITGRVYLPHTATTPKVTRKIKLVINSTNPTPPVLPGSFNLPIDILTGNDNDSLVMNNGAFINNGKVHSNGGIRLSNMARIGSVAIPVPVTVSNSNNIANPINILNMSRIIGDVSANLQTDGSDMSNAGLIASGGVAPVAFPNHNRAGQIAVASPAVSGASASCSGSTATWPANFHVSGDVTISNCTITIMGDVWIEGRLTLQNSTILQVDSSVVTFPVLMVDGNAGGGIALHNSAAFTPNSAGFGFIVASYSTANNSIIFNNTSNAVGSVLYSPVGTTAFNNNSGIGTRAVFSYRIVMNNVFTLTIGSPGTLIWSVGYYQQDFS